LNAKIKRKSDNSKLFAEKFVFTTGIEGILGLCRKRMWESQGVGEKWWGVFGLWCFQM
jgi:hypothetical protein